MPGKVLVVDDNADSRMVLCEQLAQLDINHDAVHSAGACIQRLMSDPAEFDLVLMDIHMPKLNGADASQWIKASDLPRHRGIPIIAVTGDRSFLAPAALSKYGMTDVLAKPFTLNQLRQALTKHFGPTRLN